MWGKMSAVSREHAKFLGSMFVTIMASQATMLMDAVIGGSLLGSDVVSAIDLVIPVNEVLYAVSLLLGMGACTAASVAFGRNDTDAVRRHFTAAIVSASFVFALMAASIYFGRNTLVDWLCGDSYLKDYTLRYLTAMVPYFAISGLAMTLKIFTSMTGRPQLVMYCALVLFAINIGCNFLFIKVFELGIESLAYSSTISIIAAILFLLPNYLNKNCAFRMTRCSMRQLLKTTKQNMRYGIGLLTADVAYIIFSFAMNAMVLRYMGEQNLFYWSVVMMLFLTCNYANAAAQETCLSLGGRYIGAGQNEDARLIYRRSLNFTIIWGTLCLVLVFIMPYRILPLFGASDAVINSTLTTIIALAIPVTFGINIVNIYLVRLLQNGGIKHYLLLSSLLYLTVPFVFWCIHLIASGHEWYSFIALIPIQLGLIFTTKKIYNNATS